MVVGTNRMDPVQEAAVTLECIPDNEGLRVIEVGEDLVAKHSANSSNRRLGDFSLPTPTTSSLGEVYRTVFVVDSDFANLCPELWRKIEEPECRRLI